MQSILHSVGREQAFLCPLYTKCYSLSCPTRVPLQVEGYQRKGGVETVYKLLCPFCFSLPGPPLSLKMLVQELMIGKYENVETKNTRWARKLVTLQTTNQPLSRVTKLPVP